MPPIEGSSSTAEELAANVDATLGLPQQGGNGDGTDTTTKEVDKSTGSDGVTDAAADGDNSGDAGSASSDAEAGADAGAGDDGSDEEAVDGAAAKAADTVDKSEQQPSNQDHFIEVEDAAGKKYKVTTIEDLPEDFTPKNNRQVIEIIQKLDRLERDIQADTERKAEDERTAQVEAARQETLTSWDNEITELQKGGRLDKPKLATDHANFLEDPAVKKVDSVFKFMAAENDKRNKAGSKNLLTSFEDALDKYELVESRKTAEDSAKTDTKLAKDKAGLIGRSSAAGNSEVPAYIPGSYRDIMDIPV
jgi:hypothetical protein